MKTMCMWRTSLKLGIKIITTRSLIVNNISQQNPSNTIEIKGHTFSFVAYKVTIILWAYMKHQHRKKKSWNNEGKICVPQQCDMGDSINPTSCLVAKSY